MCFRLLIERKALQQQQKMPKEMRGSAAIVKKAKKWNWKDYLKPGIRIVVVLKNMRIFNYCNKVNMI